MDKLSHPGPWAEPHWYGDRKRSDRDLTRHQRHSPFDASVHDINPVVGQDIGPAGHSKENTG